MGSLSTATPTVLPINELPLPPQITPGLSVAGVLLILSGLIYCFVGIRRKWIQISISSAYLVALAITVLIVYIMDPPVSLATQGAYVVGAVLPAILFGALACIFQDITEGFGCAVGGFALSMFLLVLRPGGLLTTTPQKAIFIGCWTMGVFVLSFSHYTRTYTLIASSSVGGATAVILGIDCFSLAGLKEFWVYIWGLNSNLFPPLAQSYPITRGIRVEIAGIVILSFFGILSQLRIWKIVQAQKERKHKASRDAEKQRDDAEAELGFQVEASNAESRAQWELVYGDACKEPSEAQADETHADSGIGTETGSTRKNSSVDHVKSMEHATVSTRDVSDSNEPAEYRREDENHISVEGIRNSSDSPRATASQLDSKWPFSKINSIDGQPRMSQEGGWRWSSSSKKSIAQPEMITELPTPPDATGTGSELVLMPGEYADANQIEQQVTQNFSMYELQEHKAPAHSKRLSAHTITSIEALADPNFYDDCFSIGEPVSTRLSPPSIGNETNYLGEAKDAHITKFHPAKEDASASFEIETIRLVRSDTPPSLTASDSNNTEDERTASSGDITSFAERTETQAERQNPPPQPMPKGRIILSEQAPPLRPKASLKSLEDLPQDTKPIVQRFRTDEWAKHLSVAEQPDPDPIRPVDMEEAPSTVDTAALLQTPLTAEPAPFAQTTIKAEPEPIHPARSTSSSSNSMQYTPGGRPIPSFQFSSYGPPARRASIGTGRRSWGADRQAGSQNAGLAQHVPRQPSRRSGFRHSMSPVLNSPISEDEEMSFYHPPRTSLPADTLLTERNKMLKHRDRTAYLSPSSSYTHSTASTTSRSRSDLSLAPIATDATDATDDTQPLSVRRQQLKLQQRASLPMMPTRRGMTYPPAPHPTSREHTAYTHPVHAPTNSYPYPIQVPPARRTTDPSLRQRTMLSHWRASMAASADASPWTACDDSSFPAPAQAITPHGRLVPTRPTGPEPWRHRNTAQGTQGWGTRGEARALAGMGAEQVDAAHRQVLRRMQGDARRRLEAAEVV